MQYNVKRKPKKNFSFAIPSTDQLFRNTGRKEYRGISNVCDCLGSSW